MRKIRWGVISTASIGLVEVLPAMQKGQYTQLVGIASRNLAKALPAAEQLGIPKAYGTYAELLADPEIEAVYNPLPNHLHVPWSIKALEAGKHVLCEKPLGLDAEDAPQLLEVSRRYPDLKVMEAFMDRFHPRSERIKQLVEEGALGKISLIRSACTFPVKRDGSNERLFLPEMGGGSLWDVGCYGVSVARWLLGEEPTAVSAQADYSIEGVDTNFAGTLHFPNGALAVIESSFTAALQQTFSVTGESGAIELPHDAFIPWEKHATFTLPGANDEHGHLVAVLGPFL